MKITPSSLNRSFAIRSLGYSMLSQSVWNLPFDSLLVRMSNSRLPSSSRCPLRSANSSPLMELSSSYTNASDPVLYGGSMYIILTLPR